MTSRTKLPSKLKRLLAMCAGVEPMVDTNTGKAYVRAGDEDQSRLVPLDEFVQDLGVRYANVTKMLAGRNALGEIRGHLLAVAARSKAPLAYRVSARGGRTYIDLGDAARTAICIEDGRWRPIQPSVPFARHPGTLALPRPKRGGKLYELRDLLNIPDDRDWVLYAAWIVNSLRPLVTYSLLELFGQSEAGKTTAARFARALVDPISFPFTSRTSDESILAMAANAHVVMLNNISSLPLTASNVLCALTHDGSASDRAKYTNFGLAGVTGKRPVIVTSINSVVEEPDLMSRALPIYFSRMPQEKLASADVDAAFTKIAPRVFGAALNALADGMVNMRTLVPPWTPRIADYALLAYSAEDHFGCKPGTVESALRRRDHRRHRATRDGWGTYRPLRRFLRDAPERSYFGPLEKLLGQLKIALRVGEGPLPDDGTRFSKELGRVEEALRDAGWRVELHKRKGDERAVRLALPIEPST